MHKFFVSANNISDNKGIITGDDVKHIYKVLRLSQGSRIILNNCEGVEYLGEIEDINKGQVNVKIIEQIHSNNESKIKIHLFQGVPKGSKMDLIVQKGTELGVYKFIPVIMNRVDVKLKGEFKKLDRLNKIALEAAKQSQRSIVPEVCPVVDFKSALNMMKEMELIVVPYENAQNFGIKSLIKKLNKENINIDSIMNVAIVIGPEGGFEEKEINELKENNGYIVTLGNRILRTETAGFTATALLQYELSDMGGV